MQAKHAVVLTIDEMGEGEGKQDTPYDITQQAENSHMVITQQAENR